MRFARAACAAWLLGVSTGATRADAIELTAAVPAPTLATCMYRLLRAENPGQMRLTPLGTAGDYELIREMNGGGYSVFAWRADIRSLKKSGAALSVEITRPVLDPSGYEIEVRQAVQACSKG